MSILIQFAAEGAQGPLEAARRRRLRGKLLATSGAVLLILAMAALPLPLWRSCGNLSARVGELRGWIAEARGQEEALAGFRASGASREAERQQAELSRWLAPHVAVDTRNALLVLAQAAGLTVTDIQMSSAEEPFASDDATDVRVLGSAPVAATRPAAPRLDVRADRYVLSGNGTVAQVLLLCGVAHVLPAPLRLRSVQLDGADDGVRFTLCLEKFLPRSRAP